MNTLRYILITMTLSLILCGCFTTNEIYVTKTWEGHFFNTNDFFKATQNINLDKKESIWVLSDKTLLKTLENARKGN